MNVRRYQNVDRSSLIELWTAVFPDTLPHNEPSILIDTKLAVDDLIFVAEHKGNLVGAFIAGYQLVVLYCQSVSESPRNDSSSEISCSGVAAVGLG